jgi:hypothetical protein
LQDRELDAREIILVCARSTLPLEALLQVFDQTVDVDGGRGTFSH